MEKLLTTIILLCLSVGVNAQLTDRYRAFLKVSYPDVLEYWYTHHKDCPWTEPEAEQIIEGVIKRSRIRTSEGTGINIYLNTVANCMDLGNGYSYAIHFNIQYGDFPMLYERPYGGLVMGSSDSKSFFLQTLQTYIESAITDFVEVNFLSDSN